MFKYIKKVLRGLALGLGIILLLLVSVIISLQFSSVQTYVSQKLAAYISKTLNYRFSIGKVAINYHGRVQINDIFLGDGRGDTLIYLQNLKAGLHNIPLSVNPLNLGAIDISRGVFNIKKYKGDSTNTFIKFINSFGPGDSTKKSAFKLNCKRLRIYNSRFIFHDQNIPDEGKDINYDHLVIKKFNTELQNLKVVDDEIQCYIRSMAFNEKSGFKVSQFNTDLQLNSENIHCNNLKIKTGLSLINASIDFTYKNWESLGDFVNKVGVNCNFSKSHLNLADLAYFSDAIWGIRNMYTINGSMYGTIADLRTKKLSIGFGKKSNVLVSGFIKGLPDAENAVFKFTVHNANSNKKDLEQIILPPFGPHDQFVLPDMVGNAGDFSFKGMYTGRFTNFKIDGDINSALGALKADIKLSTETQNDLSYDGKISTESFYLGRLLDLEPELGVVAFSAKINGNGLQASKLNGTYQLDASSIAFHNYKYGNIHLNAKALAGNIVGKLDITDPNVTVKLDVGIDFATEVENLKAKGFIDRLRPGRLHLSSYFDSSSYVSSDVDLNIKGFGLNQLTGYINLNQMFFALNGKGIYSNAITFSSGKTGEVRSLSLSSDFLDANIDGIINLATIGRDLKKLSNRYLHWFKLGADTVPQKQQFNIVLTVKKINPLLAIVKPELSLMPGSQLSAGVNTDFLYAFKIGANFPQIVYGTKRISGLSVSTTYTAENISQIKIKTDKVYLADSTYFNGLMLQVSARDHVLKNDLFINDFPEQSNKAVLHFTTSTVKDSTVRIHFNPSDILLNNKKWTIDPANNIEIGRYIAIQNLNFSNAQQQLKIEGEYKLASSANAKSRDLIMELQLSSFDLESVNQYTKTVGYNIAGIADGKVNLITNTTSSRLGLASNMEVKHISVNNDSLGNLKLNAAWDDESKRVALGAVILQGRTKILDVNGYYDTKLKNDNLSFNISLQKFYLQVFNAYLKDYVSEIKGQVSAEVKVSGTFDQPSIIGSMQFQRTSFIINYLGTRYNTSDKVLITGKSFVFNDFVLNDVNGNQAKVNGSIDHKNFSNIKMLLNVRTNNFQLLNTTERDNELYYGTAYTSGTARFLGTLANLKIEVDMTTNKGTKFNIPLTNANSVSESNFITFIDTRNLDPTQKRLLLANTKKRVDLSGMELDFDLNVTDDAELQIIFDQKVGDVIKTKGNGNIKLAINTLGKFNIYGSYSIVSGDYLFTLQNFINKRFKISEGNIRWTGDALGATLNIFAVYQTRASIYELIPDEQYRNRIPVDCILKISNTLADPEISFDLTLPGVDENTKAIALGSLRSRGDQAITQQVLSLLVFNRFTSVGNTPGGGGSVASGFGTNTGTEFLANQVGNLISGNGNIDVGFNYHAKDELSNQQYQVMFNTRVFNDKLSLNGNVGQNSNSVQNTTNIVGDFNAEYSLSNTVRLKAFNRSNVYSLTNYYAPYTQGIGITYKEEFDTIEQLMRRWQQRKVRRKEDKQEKKENRGSTQF